MQNTAIGKALSRSRNALTTKMLLVMRMTAFLLILFFQASAFTESAAQVTLKESSATLEKVLKTIQQQSAYDLVFDKALLQAKAKPVTVNVTNVPVKEALDKVFEQQELLTYSLSGKIISVMEREGNPAMMLTKTEIPVIDVRGKVTDENGKPVVGASVQVKGANKGTTTDENGFYVLSGVDEKATLVISAVNIETREVGVNGRNEINLVAKVKISQLDDVAVTVNTGYQQLKPNETTGSVTNISKDRLDERIAPDILSKLEGITNGLVFNKDASTGANKLRVRGESTLFGYTEPLIVVDNFPYDGDIRNINPNDVESITVLKDAAAASIWGVQAGNGVIVITTKSGKVNRPLKVEVYSNLTLTERPNLFATPQISSSDFIDFETFLFGRGNYNSALNNINKPVVSPVVDILNNRRSGLISSSDSATQIDRLRKIDLRNQISDYMLRSAFNQQYQINLSSGSTKATYYFSAGYDSELSDVVGNMNRRFTLTGQSTFRPLKGLQIKSGIFFNQTNQTANGFVSIPNSFPYMSLVDEDGKQLSIPQRRAKFEDTIANRNFLDWKYYPLAERENNSTDSRLNEARILTSLKYILFPGVNLELTYQYQRNISQSKRLNRPESFQMRDRYNTFAILNNGNFAGSNYNSQQLNRGQLNISNSNQTSNYIRANVSVNKTFQSDHTITGIIGIEQREVRTEETSNRFYGFDESTGTFVIPNIYALYPTYLPGNGSSAAIDLPGNGVSFAGTLNRFRSYFGNLAYSYKGRYTLSTSGRLDGSNYFGVNTNKKSIPLWSIGAKWDISKESFYKLEAVSSLSFRITYGYNGNLARNIAAITTFRYLGNASYTGLPYAGINNIPNPELRWERIGQINAGIDFAFKNNRITGSMEFFRKTGTDLIGDVLLDPTTGITELRGNFSAMRTNGMDVQIHTRNIVSKFGWNTSLIFNYAAEKVTRFDKPSSVLTYLNSYAFVTPIVGKPIYSLFSYKWGGLDPANGNPRIILGDTLNKTYTSATTGAVKMEELSYSGRYNPPIVGSLENSFSFGNISLRINMIYKLGHYFRRNSINYSQLAVSWQNGHSDFSNRWQNPGDELFTNVPSLIYPINSTRDNFYNRSDVLIEKADHIRLQFIGVSYNLGNRAVKLIGVQGVQFNFYVNNIGILWRANKLNIDPDYPYLNTSPSRTYSLGVKVEL